MRDPAYRVVQRHPPDSVEPGAPLKILLVSPFPPGIDALHGGARAIGGLAAAMATSNRVALLYLRAEDDPAVAPELIRCCDTVVAVSRDEPRGGPGRWVQRARNLVGLVQGRPVWVSKWAARGLKDALERVIREWRPDVIEVAYEIMAPLPVSHPVIMNLTIYDPAHAAARDAVRARRWSPVAWLDARAWERHARRAIRSVDGVVVLTTRDEDAVRMLGTSVAIQRIALGHSVPVSAADPGGTGVSEVVFIGNHLHPPNRDAARWLALDVFPAVRKAVPGARLLLVGPGAPLELGRVLDGIEVLGRVADLRTILDRAAVVVAPIRTGGGMRVKVLDAMAAGKAMVATPLATEGLEVVDGRDLIHAESAEDFSAAVVSLLRDEPRRTALAQAARRWAVAHLGWDTAAETYVAHYRRLLQMREPGGGSS
jgi:polysaccharide biosynthesis protein PslH